MPGMRGIGGRGIVGGKGIVRAGGGGDGVKPGIGGKGNNGAGGGWNGLAIRGGGWKGLGIRGDGWNGFGGKIGGKSGGKSGGRSGGKRSSGWASFSSCNWVFFKDSVVVGFEFVVFPSLGGGNGSPGRFGRGGTSGNGGSSGNLGRGGRYGLVGSWIGGKTGVKSGGKRSSGWDSFSSCNWVFFKDSVVVGFAFVVFPRLAGGNGSPGRFGRGGTSGNGGRFGRGGTSGNGGRFGRGGSGNGGSTGNLGRGGRYGLVGSWIGGGKGKSSPSVWGSESLLEPNSLEFWMLGFWLHRFGCFNGLKVKNPAENMWVPCFLDLRWSEDEVAVDATAQYGSLLLINFTEHPSIFFTCLLTEKGKCTLNSPCWSVFTSLWKLGFEVAYLHSTATDAPAYNFGNINVDTTETEPKVCNMKNTNNNNYEVVEMNLIWSGWTLRNPPGNMCHSRHCQQQRQMEDSSHGQPLKGY